jgi:hypothetical protein
MLNTHGRSLRAWLDVEESPMPDESNPASFKGLIFLDSEIKHTREGRAEFF